MRMLAAKRGPRRPKLIVIEPSPHAHGHHRCDLHLQLKPGTNVALLNGICHLLIENGTIDHDFIARHTTKFDQFKPPKAAAFAKR